MLFSDPEIFQLLNDRFECAWQAVRSVPKATIDFGDGHVLERTLAGNIVTWFCTPGGGALHAIPGLVGQTAYLVEVRAALDLWAVVREGHGGAVARFHAAQSVSPPAVEPSAIEVVDFSKRVVEQPIKGALGGVGAATPMQSTNWSELGPIPSLAPINFSRGADVSKMVVEEPIKLVLAGGAAVLDSNPLLSGVNGGSNSLALDRDTAIYLGVRRPLMSRLLSAAPLVAPEAIYHDVFRDVLHVDLEDPYLGLAPYVLGGEVGRH